MPPAKRLVWRAGAAVLGLVAVGLAWLSWDAPRPAAARIQAAPDVVAVNAGRSYAWIIRGERGVALVDAGLDSEGTAILAELAAQHRTPRDVHAVLLTSGHIDHWAGARLFPDATVYVGAEDAAVLRGERKLQTWGARAFRLFTPSPIPPPRLREVSADESIDVAGTSIRVIRAPGNTKGSLVFLHGDVLFTGDTLLGKGDGVRPLPFFRNEDTAQVRTTLRRLLDLPFRRIADGHHGLTDDAHAKLRRHLD